LTGVSAPALAFLGFLAAVWAPVVEETFFRGAFYSAWRQSGGRWVAGVGTGVIFAAVHPQGWTAIPALGAVGLVMALLREWRGSVIASMTAHALNNGTLFAVMVVVMR
jgi:membrane protease YdiL (CAAX protease family)